MPLPNTAVPAYPDVPIAPGVPAVLRQAGAIASAAALLTGDAGGLAGQFSGPQWGIYDQNGLPVIVADSVFSLDYRQEWRIATAPQEQGAFLSYNKVSSPFGGRVTFNTGGTESTRAIFLAEIAAAAASLELYSLVMPEKTFPSVNVTHYDFRRSQAAGATLLSVDVWVEEVRVTGAAQFSNTAAPSGANPVNAGAVQPVNPAQAQNPSADGQQTVTPAGGLT